MLTNDQSLTMHFTSTENVQNQDCGQNCKNKRYHRNVLLKSFHMNGPTVFSSTDSKVRTKLHNSRFGCGGVGVGGGRWHQ